jgi:cadmium resistance protein CadD (predicted permease)
MWITESESRSLLRNALERLGSSRFAKRSNIYHEIVLQVTIRIIASIFAVFVFKYLKGKWFERLLTLVGIIILVIEIILESKSKK